MFPILAKNLGLRHESLVVLVEGVVEASKAAKDQIEAIDSKGAKLSGRAQVP